MDYTTLFKEIGASAVKLVKDSGNSGRTFSGTNPLGQKTLRMDLLLEDLVIEKLGEANLDGILVTEEKGEVAVGSGGSENVFVLDPLDGSNNFLRGVGFYGLVLARASGRKYSDLTDSYVINLVSGDEYYTDGRSSFWNNKKIKSSDKTDLSKCVMEYDPVSDRSVYDRARQLLAQVRDIRRFGANAIGLCYIATGGHQIFLDLSGTLSVIHAPALHIIEVAGGVVSDSVGEPINPALEIKASIGEFVCTGNKPLHEKVVSLIK